MFIFYYFILFYFKFISAFLFVIILLLYTYEQKFSMLFLSFFFVVFEVVYGTCGEEILILRQGNLSKQS